MRWVVAINKFTKKHVFFSVNKQKKIKKKSQKKWEKRGRNEIHELEFGKMTVRKIRIWKIEFRKIGFRKIEIWKIEFRKIELRKIRFRKIDLGKLTCNPIS